MSTPAERYLEENADGEVVDNYAAAADALVAAGLVSAERAGYWKAENARAAAALAASQGSFDPEVEARCEELLQALFAAVRPRSGDDWDPASFHRYQDALMTLSAIGALSAERARPWVERHHQAMTPAGGWPAPQPEPEMPFTAGNLSAVVRGPDARLDGMRVTHIELYGDCVIVHYHHLLPPEPADPVERRRLLEKSLELHDDHGTEYRTAAIPRRRGCRDEPDAGGWPDVVVACRAFVPGAPLDAGELTVTWRDHRFSASLGDA